MTDTIIAPTTLPDTAAAREVVAMMDTLYASWTARERDAANAFLSADARIVLWGTSADESIERQEDADLGPWLAQCPPWTRIAPTRRSMGVQGDLAWVADDARGDWDDGAGRTGFSIFRITCVWQREDGAWRCIHSHFSEHNA